MCERDRPNLHKYIHNITNNWYHTRTANIVAIFKKGSQKSTENYRPVSLTSVVCKVLEHIIHRHIMNHCDQHNLPSSHQHGFRQKHSCESQLILSTEYIYRQYDKNKQVDMLILDFTKAFDTVPHQRLLMKLKHYGIDSNLHRTYAASSCRR